VCKAHFHPFSVIISPFHAMGSNQNLQQKVFF
jgi:hypothetical protein